MAKKYASDIALEVTNDLLQIFGYSGSLRGMEVERVCRDAKISTICEGTNEVRRVVSAGQDIGTKENMKLIEDLAKTTSAVGFKNIKFLCPPLRSRVAQGPGLHHRQVHPLGHSRRKRAS